LLGISLQGFMVALFFLWPFFDAKKEDNLLKRQGLFALSWRAQLGRSNDMGKIFMIPDCHCLLSSWLFRSGGESNRSAFNAATRMR
jgi:hypothetical protein